MLMGMANPGSEVPDVDGYGEPWVWCVQPLAPDPQAEGGGATDALLYNVHGVWYATEKMFLFYFKYANSLQLMNLKYFMM